MPKPPSRKTLRNKLDKLWATILRTKANGKCEICKRQECKLDIHHINGRVPEVLRWNLTNGISLCFRCHRLGAHHPALDEQYKFRQNLIYLRGEEALETLSRLRYSQTKLSIPDLKNLVKEYQGILESLKKDQ